LGCSYKPALYNACWSRDTEQSGIKQYDYSNFKLNLLCSASLASDPSGPGIECLVCALRAIGGSKDNNPAVSKTVLRDDGIEKNSIESASLELFDITVVLLDEQQYNSLCKFIEEQSTTVDSNNKRTSVNDSSKPDTHLSQIVHFTASAIEAQQRVLPVCIKGIKSEPSTASLRVRRRVSLLEIRPCHVAHDIELLKAVVFEKTVATQIGVDQDVAAGAVLLNSDNGYPAKRYIPKNQVPDERLTTVTSQELDQWSVVKTESTHVKNDNAGNGRRQQLTRNYRFDSFRLAIAFMERVAAGCDIADHHPNWCNSHKSLSVSLSTWDAEYPCVTERDLALATYMDKVFETDDDQKS